MKELLLVLVASFAFAQEPLKIHGIYLGQSVQDYIKTSSNNDKISKFDLSNCNKELALSPDDPPEHPSDRNTCEGLQRASAGRTTDLVRAFVAPDVVRFGKGVVIGFQQSILPESTGKSGYADTDWEKVLHDLKGKLGEPYDSAPVVMQNGFGATFSYRAAKWKTKDAYVDAQEQRHFSDETSSPKIVVISVVGKTWQDAQNDPAAKPDSLK